METPCPYCHGIADATYGDDDFNGCHFCYGQRTYAAYLEQEEDWHAHKLHQHNLIMAALSRMIDEPCAGDGRYLSLLIRYLYCFKLIICFFLGWKFNGRYRDGVEVVTVYSHGCSYDWSAGWLEVGAGFLRGWSYEFVEDGETVL